MSVRARVHLDATDWAILRDLYRWDATNLPEGPLRISLSDLAARTGFHRNTVHAHLTAMRKAGVLEGMGFEPRPAPLGLVRSGFMFLGARYPDADAVETALTAFPSVSSAVLGDAFLFLHFWNADGGTPEKTAKALSRALDAKRSVPGYISSQFPAHPADRIAPTSLESRLMVALIRDPTRSMVAVGRELGISPRTAERRARALTERGLGAMVPRLRPGRIKGSFLVEYVAWKGREGAAQSLAQAFPDRLVGPFGQGQVANVGVPMSSPSEMERRRSSAEQRPGVGPLSAVLVYDIAYLRPFESWLSARVESAQRDGTRG